MILNYKKLVPLILVVTLTSGFLIPQKTSAQIPVTDAAHIGVTGTTSAAEIAAIGTAASAELAAKAVQTLVINNPADAAGIAGISSAEAACKGIDVSEQIASTADQLSNFTLIGGSAVEATTLSARIVALQTVLACREATLAALDVAARSALSVVGAQGYTQKQNELSAEITILKTRIDNLKARQSASVKDVLKAVMVKIILNLNKSLTTELVNKMIDKYKISDYLAYGDALATQVYSMKYIADNFEGDAEKQLMVRSLLQSEKLPGKIKTVQAMATSQAQKYIGEACKVTTPEAQQDEMYFINCLAALGSPAADKNWHISQAIDLANAANTAGKQTAAAEVTQSNGYAPPRNCEGSIAQQKGIDTQVDAAAIALQNAMAVKQKLVTAGAPASEIAKAQAALDQAIANYDALFAKLSAGGGKIGDNGKAKSAAIIDICEAITSPANFVATSLGNFLKQHLDQGSKLESNNLPFYATFLADVASNFLTNILTGNKSKSQVLKEAGVGALTGTIIGINDQINNGGGGGGTPPPISTGSVTVGARPLNGTTQTTNLTAGQPYVLVINFRDLIATAANGKDPIFNPYRALITGVSGQSDSNVTLDASDLANGNIAFDFTPTTAGSFTIKVQFFARGTQASPGDVPLNTGGGWSQTFVVTGIVRGETTAVSYSGFSPRGPVQSFR